MMKMKKTLNINFVGMFKVAGAISFLLMIASIVMFFTKGLNYGVDFKGGVEIQVKFKTQTDMKEMREFLAQKNIPLSQLQTIGEE